jgi:Fe-S cluster assembly protein SufD
LADKTTAKEQVLAYIEAAPGRLFTMQESEHALEQARNAAAPSRLEEDWRKTDPDVFPWNRLEEVDPAQTRTDVAVSAIGGGQATGLEPLEANGEERCRAMQMIAGDDYDAKFLYYHKALSRNAVCFRVMKGFKGDPVQLVQKATGPGLATFTTVLLVEAGADVVLYDRWEASDDSPAAVGRTEIIVEDGAKLTYLQEDQISAHTAFYRRARIQLGNDAKLNWFSATPGAPWHAARLEIALLGKGSEATFKGLFAGTGESHADHRTHQYHGAPQCTSNLTMKTLLAGHSHSIYQGLITVPQQAQRTDAYQQCRNLLLEAGTHADAIPKLEIIADDVRCTHGASMGSVNPEQVFYMETRGLTKLQAMVAIASGFAEEIIRFVPVEAVQSRWRNLVARTIGRVQG